MVVINDLLKATHRFYPVGINSLMGDYEGFKQFREILTCKINDVMEAKITHWTKLKGDINSLFEEERIVDLSFNQFPSYQINIKSISGEYQGFKIERQLVLNISLLCSYYTLFFETKIHSILTDENSDLIIGKQLSFYGTNHLGKDEEEKTKEFIEKNFAGYQFVHHKILFDYLVDGCGTYSNWQEYNPGMKNPIYSFLFDSHFQLENTTILQ